MGRDSLVEQFFNILISGNRREGRAFIEKVLGAGWTGRQVVTDLIWPTLEQIQSLYRNDQLSELAHHFATRLLRTLADQVQLHLPESEGGGRTVLLVCGPQEPEELAGQLTCDLLESAGFEVYFAGGGVAHDEVVEQLAALDADVLVVFGAVAETVPVTRTLIDHLHEIGTCPNLQIAVGGGVFNRADGLAEEIGADVWAGTPHEMVEVLRKHPDQRMDASQRTVGRKRRGRRSEAA